MSSRHCFSCKTTTQFVTKMPAHTKHFKMKDVACGAFTQFTQLETPFCGFVFHIHPKSTLAFEGARGFTDADVFVWHIHFLKLLVQMCDEWADLVDWVMSRLSKWCVCALRSLLGVPKVDLKFRPIQQPRVCIAHQPCLHRKAKAGQCTLEMNLLCLWSS